MVALAVKLLAGTADRGYCLLRRRTAPWQGLWDLPGGTVEPQEAPEEALRREVREELGVELAGVTYAGAHWLDADTLSMLYRGRLAGSPRNLEPDRCDAVRSVDLKDVPAGQLSPTARFAATIRQPVAAPPPPYFHQDRPVLLLQPFFPLGDAEAASIPLGLAYVHAALAGAGIEADVLDCTIPSDYARFVNLSELNAAVVGVQFHSTMSWDFCVRACRRVRRMMPTVRIVAGGELAASRGHELLRNGVADCVVTQEGEAAFPQLVHLLLAGDEPPYGVPGILELDQGKVVGTPAVRIERLDGLPRPSVDAFRWNEYGQWTMMTSRGCPYRCTYCSSAAFWDHVVRYHSAEWIVTELDRIAEFGAEDVYIADDTFTLHRRRTEELCDRLAGRAGPGWSCLTRVDRVDDGLLARMARAGCRQISFGFETANDRTLDAVAKRTSNARAEQAIRACHRVGIRTRVSVIIGLPGESRSDVERTMGALEHLMPNEVQLYALTPHDGTALFGRIDELGVRVLVDDPTVWSRDVLNPVCETATLSRQDIVELGRECIDRLVARGYVDLGRLTGPRKIGAEYTVGTAFTPVQGVRAINAG